MQFMTANISARTGTEGRRCEEAIVLSIPSELAIWTCPRMAVVKVPGVRNLRADMGDRHS